MKPFQAVYRNWESLSANLVAQFREFYAQNMNDPWYSDTVARLCRESQAFQQLWERHEVKSTPAEAKQMNHPQLGLIVLQPNSFRYSENGELTLKVFTPLPSTDSMNKLTTLYRQLLHEMDARLVTP